VRVVDNLLYGGASLLPLFAIALRVRQGRISATRWQCARRWKAAISVILWRPSWVSGVPQESDLAQTVNVDGHKGGRRGGRSQPAVLFGSRAATTAPRERGVHEDTPLNPLSLYDKQDGARNNLMENCSTIAFRVRHRVRRLAANPAGLVVNECCLVRPLKLR